MTIHRPIIGRLVGRLVGRLPALVVIRDRSMPYASRTEISALGAGKIRLTDGQAYWSRHLRVARYRDVNC